MFKLTEITMENACLTSFLYEKQKYKFIKLVVKNIPSKWRLG